MDDNTVTESITESTIKQGLAQLDIRPTCHLMVHAALSQFGHVEDGAQTVVAALRESVGPKGAVIVPSFRDSIRSVHYALRDCQDQCPQKLCPSQQRGYTGAIGETVRQQPDAIRSCHPTHSWVGIGGGAQFLLEGHGRSTTPCGSESPFLRLLERDGVLLLIGVGVNALTNIHVVEDVRNVPYLSSIDPPHRHATYTTSGRRIQYRFPDLLHNALVESEAIQSAQIGQATCHRIGVRDLGSFLWLVTEDDPWCLVVRPTVNAYDPEADARQKTQSMVTAWRRNPDRKAWEQLLAASKQPVRPVLFQLAVKPSTDCPAYRGVVRGYHRCAANDLPPWERFEDYPTDEPGVATCEHCNWPNADSARATNG